MDIFNNREIALGIWVATLLSWSTTSAKVRESFVALFKCLTQRVILYSLGLMALYIMLVVYGLYKIDLWSLPQLKNTIIWCFTVGIVALARINKISENISEHSFSVIKDALRVSVFLEFFVNFYVFPLWVELITVPLITLLVAMQAIAERDDKHAPVKKFISAVLLWSGVGLVTYAFYSLIANFSKFANIETLGEFSLPPILTLLYLPFIIVTAIYSNYESVFIRLKFTIKDAKLRAYAQRKAAVVFHFRTSLLKRWVRNLMIDNPESKENINHSIYEVKRVWKQEKNPPAVPFEIGWSPALAEKFLISEGIHASDYHRLYDDRWCSSEERLKLGKDIFDNTISYCVEGDRNAAQLLEIILTINDLKNSEEHKKRFCKIAGTLFFESLRSEMPNELKENIMHEKESVTILYNKEVIISINRWVNRQISVCEIGFLICNPRKQLHTDLLRQLQIQEA